MTKRAEAKYKIDRRMGQNIWGRPKSPVNRREYGPGQHGQRRKGKLSDFGTQLKAKQKLKGYYGNISEKQFRKYYAEAIRMKGDSRRQSDRPFGAPARRRRLSREIRADGFRRAPVRQSRPHQGQRPPRQHSVLSGEGRRRDRDQGKPRASSSSFSRRVQLAERDVPEYYEVDHTQDDREAHPRSRLPRKCPIRCRWSRTSSSSSIRAKAEVQKTRRWKVPARGRIRDLNRCRGASRRASGGVPAVSRTISAICCLCGASHLSTRTRLMTSSAMRTRVMWPHGLFSHKQKVRSNRPFLPLWTMQVFHSWPRSSSYLHAGAPEKPERREESFARRQWADAGYRVVRSGRAGSRNSGSKISRIGRAACDQGQPDADVRAAERLSPSSGNGAAQIVKALNRR